MNLNLLTKKLALAFALSVLLGNTNAVAATTYLLSITNGGVMPISPMAVYVKDGQNGVASVGQEPSAGLIQLCQMGNPAKLVQELRMDSSVKMVTQTTSPILPGESKVIEVRVASPRLQSIHFVSMYGKTKDVCASGFVGSHSMYALRQHITSEILGKDNVIQTGAFLDPALPMDDEADSAVCSGSADAISCLRELALPNSGISKIRFFNSYLPSLVSFLETKYGSADVLSLSVPTSGAVQFQLKLKH